MEQAYAPKSTTLTVETVAEARNRTTTPPAVPGEPAYTTEQTARILSYLDLRHDKELERIAEEHTKEKLRQLNLDTLDDRISERTLQRVARDLGYNPAQVDVARKALYPSVQDQREFFDTIGAIPSPSAFIEEMMDQYTHTVLERLHQTYPHQEFSTKTKVSNIWGGAYDGELTISRLNPAQGFLAAWRKSKEEPILHVDFKRIHMHSEQLWGEIIVTPLDPALIVCAKDLMRIRQENLHSEVDITYKREYLSQKG